MPGMNGGSSRIWYSPRRSSRSGKLTPAAPTSTTTESCSPPPTASSTSVYSSPAGPDSSRATSAFMRRRSAEAERGPLRCRKVGDLAPLGGHVVDRRHACECGPLVLKERCPLYFATADDENRCRIWVFLTHQVCHHRRDIFRRQLLEHLGRQDVLRHPGGRNRRDRVGLDVVLGALLSQRVDQADETQLRCAVVGLPEVAEEPAGGRRDDDPAVALLAEVRPRR